MLIRVMQKLIGDEGLEISYTEVFRGSMKEYESFVPENPSGPGIRVVQNFTEVRRGEVWVPMNTPLNIP